MQGKTSLSIILQGEICRGMCCRMRCHVERPWGERLWGEMSYCETVTLQWEMLMEDITEVNIAGEDITP